MEPDSPLNRAIQEWSRRFLRGSKISLTAPVIHHERFTELHLMKNEAIPSVYSTFNILDNKDSNLVNPAKDQLKSVVTLQIVDSGGTVVKTMYAAGA